jgi:DNA-directed RNA polymerase alpha subunit
MWKPVDTAPKDTRVLVSAKGKVWIGRHTQRWDANAQKLSNDLIWSIEGKTTAQVSGWQIDGWSELPTAKNAKVHVPWRPTTYLDALELSVRSGRILRENGLLDKSQIMALSKKDILALAGAGERTASEILEVRDKPYPPYLEQLSRSGEPSTNRRAHLE